MEFVRKISTDGSAVRFDGLSFEAKAFKDSCIGVVHLLVTFGHALGVAIERVGIFHDEFPSPHHPKAWPNLIAKLGLYLVKIDRQLTVTADRLARECCNNLFMGRTKAEVTLVTIGKTHQLRAVVVPAAGFTPQLGRLHGGQ